MNSSLIIIIFLIIGCVSKAQQQSKRCDYFQALKPNGVYSIASPGFSRNYLRGTDCRWAAEAPPGYKILLLCNEVRLPNSLRCKNDRIIVSNTGRSDLRDGKTRCGSASFSETSTSTKMTIALKTGAFTKGGRFKCLLKTVANSCSCGLANRGRIVGGTETQVNEYPSMAGVVDANEQKIFCGATISEIERTLCSKLEISLRVALSVSSTHALSAAHCSLGRSVNSLALLVGEHDIAKGNETPFTVLLRIVAFIKHPSFNTRTNENDIALIRTQQAMTFTQGVQPACLPFRFRSESFVNRMVQATGWGASEFAGPSSNILKHVTLTIVNRGNCSSSQMCAYARGKDTCQNDSGGPLFYIENNIIFHVGIVSYGVACASNQPSVNTRVTAYLDWIQQNTRSTTYCVR